VSVAWLGGVWPGFGRGMGRGCGGGRDGDATDAGGTHLARSTLRTGATATPTFMHRDAIGLDVVDQSEVLVWAVGTMSNLLNAATAYLEQLDQTAAAYAPPPRDRDSDSGARSRMSIA
jgi:hypothetical protein